MHSAQCHSSAFLVRPPWIGWFALALLFLSLSSCGGNLGGNGLGLSNDPGGGSGPGGGNGPGGGGHSAPNVLISGLVHSGQQPVSGATIQLYAAGSNGYGSAATALLNANVTSALDGSFRGLYQCPSDSTQVYLVATGGNPGISDGTNNSALALMTGLGSCGDLSSGFRVMINEVTTVASVWALAPFLSSGAGAQLGTSSTNAPGLTNAFATIRNLVNVASGGMPGPNLPVGAALPTSELNTLADILAPCVNSSGATGECSDLFAAATPSNSTAPANTIDAALYIAQNPGNNVNALYDLVVGTPPFQPTLSSAPTDWTVAVSYTGGGLDSPDAVALDGLGNVWATNRGWSTVSKLSSTGTAISPSTGYIGGGLDDPWGAAIDESGNLWTSNNGVGTNLTSVVSEFSGDGVAISPSTGYTGGGLNDSRSIAIAPSGNVWVANLYGNSVSEFSSSGTPISPSNGYGGGGLHSPISIAVDPSGSVWVASYGNSVSKFTSSGAAISPSDGYTGGGLNGPWAIAVDGFGNAWVANRYSDSLSEFSSNGDAISPAAGYTGGGLNIPFGIAIDGTGNIWVTNSFAGQPGPLGSVSEFSTNGAAISPSTGYTGGGMNGPWGVAIDASGNVWVGNYLAVTEFVGAAAPVVTPLVTAVKNNQLGKRP